jgi:5'-deoxy-5'-methylthioadenosine phosphorylase
MSGATVGLIVGTGFSSWLVDAEPAASLDTPFGPPSAAPRRGLLDGAPVVMLARHGQPHLIAPHRVNYRANLWLLKQLGVTHVLATNTVGGIAAHLEPGALVVVDQLIDYTWGREHTFMDGDRLQHVDFTRPYDARVRAALLSSAAAQAIAVGDGGVYGCTQGPRLESAAEIERLARDGCDVVGMTAMPEAGLARELGLAYGTLCLVVNRAAGRAGKPITEAAMAAIARAAQAPMAGVLAGAAQRLQQSR